MQVGTIVLWSQVVLPPLMVQIGKNFVVDNWQKLSQVCCMISWKIPIFGYNEKLFCSFYFAIYDYIQFW